MAVLYLCKLVDKRIHITLFLCYRVHNSLYLKSPIHICIIKFTREHIICNNKVTYMRFITGTLNIL